MENQQFDLLMLELKRIHSDIKELRVAHESVKLKQVRMETEIKVRSGVISAVVGIFISLIGFVVSFYRK
ncbi:MAG: hypothetical protein ACPG5Z_00195 [Pseudoalteromonas sp.]